MYKEIDMRVWHCLTVVTDDLGSVAPWVPVQWWAVMGRRQGQAGGRGRLMGQGLGFW